MARTRLAVRVQSVTHICVVALVAMIVMVVAPLMSAGVARADVAAWLVMDLERGKVLESDNAGRPWPPASITKLMTAYVTFEAMRSGRISPRSPVILSNEAVRVPYGIKFKAGAAMTLDDAIKFMIVRSANNVSHGIAEAISGTEPAFVAEMNAVSKRIGLTRSSWRNPHGLNEDGQVTTARDMAVLTYRLWHDFPEYRHYFAIGAIQYGKKVHRSRNRLIGRYPGINGMKTGYVCNSGNNVVTSATRNGRTVAVITLGAAGFLERAVVTKTLLDRGFRKRFGGQNLSRFVADEGAGLPIIPGYCNSWNKPDPAELMVKYGPRAAKNRTILSLRSDGAPSDPTKAVISEGSEISVSDVLEAVVGQDRGVAPIRVRTGVDAPKMPAVMTAIPRPKPVPGSVLAADPAAPTAAAQDPGRREVDPLVVASQLRAGAAGVPIARDGPLALPGVNAGSPVQVVAPTEVLGTPKPDMVVPRPRPAR